MMRVIGFSMGFMAISSLAKGQEADPFYFVRADTPAFNTSQIDLDEKAWEFMRVGPTYLARNLVLPNRTRAQLLALTLAVEPENELAYVANFQLKKGKEPGYLKITKPGTDEEVEMDVIANDLLRMLELALRYPELSSNRDSQILVAMLLDVNLSIFKNASTTHAELLAAQEVFLKRHDPAPWDRILQLSDDVSPTLSRKMEPSSVTGATPAPATGLKLARRQSGLNGLMVFELDGGAMAGKASRMSATHLETVSDASAERRLRFNQNVGQSMSATLSEIATFMEVRHKKWIETGVIEFAFQEKFVPKDGDSAGLACGMMVESLVTGRELAEDFACTGSLNSDGSVQPIGGVVAKLRGADKAGCNVVALPYGNRYALSDLTILGQASVLAKMQVFIIKDFDEAWALAHRERNAEIEASIDEFERLQNQFAQSGVMNVIRSDQGQAALRGILARTPNHASARLMMTVAQGRLPKHLSLNGSMEELFNQFLHLASLVEPPPALIPNPDADLETFQKSAADIRRIVQIVEPRTSAFGAALLDFAESVLEQKMEREHKPVLREKSLEAFMKLNKALDDIRRDPELLEDLEQ